MTVVTATYANRARHREVAEAVKADPAVSSRVLAERIGATARTVGHVRRELEEQRVIHCWRHSNSSMTVHARNCWCGAGGEFVRHARPEPEPESGCPHCGMHAGPSLYAPWCSRACWLLRPDARQPLRADRDPWTTSG